MTGDLGVPQAPTPPSPPPYTNIIYNMLKGLEQTLVQKLVDIEAHLHSQIKRWESVEAQLQS